MRTELTRSAEVSYQSLSVAEACEILLTNEQDLVRLVHKENDNPERLYNWELKGGRLSFLPLNTDKH